MNGSSDRIGSRIRFSESKSSLDSINDPTDENIHLLRIRPSGRSLTTMTSGGRYLDYTENVNDMKIFRYNRNNFPPKM